MSVGSHRTLKRLRYLALRNKRLFPKNSEKCSRPLDPDCVLFDPGCFLAGSRVSLERHARAGRGPLLRRMAATAAAVISRQPPAPRIRPVQSGALHRREGADERRPWAPGAGGTAGPYRGGRGCADCAGVGRDSDVDSDVACQLCHDADTP